MSEPLNRDLYAQIYGDEYVERLDAEHRRKNGIPPRPQPQARNVPPPNPYAQPQNPYGPQQIGPYGTPLRPQPYQQPYPYGALPPGYHVARPPRREHHLGIHLLLFFLTGGIGNVIYYLWVTSENRRLGYY